MSGLKLPKLPDRQPVKLVISLRPDLNKKLQLYKDYYNHTYGEREALADLVPYMLEEFLNGDREFQKRQRTELNRVAFPVRGERQ
ncbi:DUF2274 domain-containing protein [Ferrovibrio sp.]|uniref:DUF2274 domain-containing protein n=1 Tax=Ferrovibrio sp. TaxID=1917215 RepID=UPI00311FB01A